MKPAPHLQLLPPIAASAPTPVADDALELRARDGDLAAWSEVYARHYGRLLRQLRHLTGDLAVAEELAQETFAQAMASRARYEPGRSLEAWLAGIALNMARKHWRSRQSTQRAHARLECVAEVHGAGPALDRLHLQRERSRVLYAVLAELPESLREAFTVRELEGMSTEEAAARLAISPGNLAVRISRARARIGAALRALGWLPREGGST
ncbi:RNA polymerase sigma factor [Nannocystis sp.]|uniref:RNA polymerase sigma factor n=1 Tax=Nannocystis sp. TaxID=1962667 RepID=UPI0025D00410|nr:RNA polymerase sigma factor [Nannocystis sp.]MBK7826376.1 RNA polymerase sigma factor [Nannocystis sp.]